mmetsp:Transcript_32952/g.69358  ORF Transcript_32952/g.69358 Transcript_32952/m.69358 type:complete len:91 (+) Transcript_32952:506-778(+)
MGAAEMIPGFNAEDGAMKFIVRVLCSIQTAMALMEIEFASSAAMQDIFLKFHVVYFVLASYTMKEIGGKGANFTIPGIIALFLIGSIVAK